VKDKAKGRNRCAANLKTKEAQKYGKVFISCMLGGTHELRETSLNSI
jgi:hypothetical protein